MKPITRFEYFLNGIINDSPVFSPITRLETILYDIKNGNATSITPVTREEMYYAKISGADVEIPAPITRQEVYLSIIAGEDYAIPSPLTRTEYWLAKWADISLPKAYQRIDGIRLNDNAYYAITDFKLHGSDTVRLSFSVTAACNVFGCYTTAQATDNYSIYASSSSGAKYLRYDGGTYSSYFGNSDLGKQFDVVITPTGTHGMPTDSTWVEADFESSVDMCIGTSSTSATSAKMKGDFYGNFVVDGRFNGIPCKRLTDNVIGYYDTCSKTFYEPTGSNPTAITGG